jgi:hypothetical protein
MAGCLYANRDNSPYAFGTLLEFIRQFVPLIHEVERVNAGPTRAPGARSFIARLQHARHSAVLFGLSNWDDHCPYRFITSFPLAIALALGNLSRRST